MRLLLLLPLLLALLLQLVNGRLRAVGDELRFRTVVDAGPLYHSLAAILYFHADTRGVRGGEHVPSASHPEYPRPSVHRTYGTSV